MSAYSLPISEFEKQFNIKAKPCPFCNSHALLVFVGPYPHVECVRCNASGPYPSKRTKDESIRKYEAIRLWNIRKGEPCS